MDFDLGRGLGKNISVLIAEADANHLIEGLNAHRAGIHSESATEVSRDALHPLKASDPSRAGESGELFEFHSHSGGNFHA